ncbi:MAG: type IA DNA topoisomerase [Lachnospiraceae bacterium]|nr:type IA DNA topoisomerase [Lachnospiraceae bacterium]
MGKSLFIAEKPSVAQEFAKALKLNTTRNDGYLESNNTIITWCVGHLVTMSYPEVYDEKYKKWRLDTLPFIPDEWKYEVIASAKKQYKIVEGLLNREDVDTIYVCTDSGREGEYIYRLVAQEAGVKDKAQKRVWIDSQTEEEIIRGIKEAKDISEYDNLSASAYLRAKEDYLMGINFSRLLTLKYGNSISNYLGTQYTVISVGRVMTCVLGMIVRREWEIREFVKTPFFKVASNLKIDEYNFKAEWKAVEGSKYYNTPVLYKENGFKEKKNAEELISAINKNEPVKLTVKSIVKKDEKKNAPLLYNLAELQNDCSRMFKISPDETLKIVQELYEKKLTTYPRTDARVLSTAVAKQIYKNIAGLKSYNVVGNFAAEIIENGSYKGLEKTKYVDDKKITDHYAIVPTGQGLNSLSSVSALGQKVYQLICRRFLSIFYPAAVYKKVTLIGTMPATFEDQVTTNEQFSANFKVLVNKGYFVVAGVPGEKKKNQNEGEEENENSEIALDENFFEKLNKIGKSDKIDVVELTINEGETKPPSRYNSGSIILAMENAGQLIEDEELRAQIKGSGIGTSATRAEIIKKLVSNKYISLNKKTQILSPTQLGEMIFDVVFVSIKSLLNPELTASWEKGLTYVAEGTITQEEYMTKLSGFVSRITNNVKGINNQYQMKYYYDRSAQYYRRK